MYEKNYATRCGQVDSLKEYIRFHKISDHSIRPQLAMVKSCVQYSTGQLPDRDSSAVSIGQIFQEDQFSKSSTGLYGPCSKGFDVPGSLNWIKTIEEYHVSAVGYRQSAVRSTTPSLQLDRSPLYSPKSSHRYKTA